MNPETVPERIQKILARAGIGSRRQIENWIRAGRISINDRPATLGDRITENDLIRLDGDRINLRLDSSLRLRVIAYHKPEGKICSRSDPEGRPTIFEDLPRLKQGRWVLIGRLDINSSGLLLLTTDGELANKLMHPSGGIEREYAVRVRGEVDNQVLDRLTDGVMLSDGMASFDSIRDAGGKGANHWYHVVLREGRNREVRRLWESQGVTVSRLIRVRFGPVILARDLRPGRSTDLNDVDMKALLTLAGLQHKMSASATGITRHARKKSYAARSGQKKGRKLSARSRSGNGP